MFHDPYFAKKTVHHPGFKMASTCDCIICNIAFARAIHRRTFAPLISRSSTKYQNPNIKAWTWFKKTDFEQHLQIKLKKKHLIDPTKVFSISGSIIFSRNRQKARHGPKDFGPPRLVAQLNTWGNQQLWLMCKKYLITSQHMKQWWLWWLVMITVCIHKPVCRP